MHDVPGLHSGTALGLALPYLVLSLPTTVDSRSAQTHSAWMETLKQLTAVPLFLTAIWLAWVFGNFFVADGVDRLCWLLVGFLTLAIAGWALGRWPARWGSGITAIVLIAVALYFPLHKTKAPKLTWQPYTKASYEAARTSGQPVFIDFTAAWCLSLQV